MADDKRCMTTLDAETLERLTKARGAEQRSESQMIAMLVKEALDARDARK